MPLAKMLELLPTNPRDKPQDRPWQWGHLLQMTILCLKLFHELLDSVEPSYLNTATKELARQILEINFTELRRCMANVLNHSLTILYFDSGSMRDADINTELKVIVPVTIVCA
jgi:hypothetical protein